MAWPNFPESWPNMPIAVIQILMAKKEANVITANMTLTENEWIELKELLPKESKYSKLVESILRKSKGKFSKTKPKLIQTSSSNILNIATTYRNKLVKNSTIQEALFRSFLNDFRIKYEFQKIQLYGNKFYIVDFYLSDYNCVVEIDGNHHYTSEYLLSDEIRTQHLKELRIDQVYRIKNKDCNRAFLIKWWEDLDLRPVSKK